MKAIKGFMQMLQVGAFAFLIFSLSSCSKNEYDGMVAEQPSVQQRVAEHVKGMKLNLRTPDGKTTITATGGTNSSTSFSSGNTSVSFSSGDGSTNYASGDASSNYANGPTGNNFNASGTLSVGGGSIDIAGKTVNLDYVLCVDAGDLFGDISEFEGEDIHLLVGISGKFTDPENARLDYMVFMFLIGDGSGTHTMDLEAFVDNQGAHGNFGLVEIIDFSKLKQDGSFENIDDAKLYISLKGAISASSGAYLYNNCDFAEVLAGQGDMDFGKKVKGSGNLLCQ